MRMEEKRQELARARIDLCCAMRNWFLVELIREEQLREKVIRQVDEAKTKWEFVSKGVDRHDIVAAQAYAIAAILLTTEDFWELKRYAKEKEGS